MKVFNKYINGNITSFKYYRSKKMLLKRWENSKSKFVSMSETKIFQHRKLYDLLWATKAAVEDINKRYCRKSKQNLF